MKLKDINLDNIKLAIFDFDDTLAIHKDKDYVNRKNESEKNLLNYYLKAYLNPEVFYDEIEECKVSDKMIKLIDYLRKNNVKMYCVSGMKFSFNFKAKQYFINKYYGKDIEVISSGNQELKVDAAKIIAMLNNCKLNEILFVDDRKDVIELLNNNGIKAINVNDIKL